MLRIFAGMRTLFLTLAMAGIACISQAQILRESCLLHLPFTSSFADVSAHTAVPNAMGSIVPVADAGGNATQAAQFNGSTDYIDFASADIYHAHFPLSFSVWINLDQTNGNYPVFISDNSTAAYAGVVLQVLNGVVFFGYGDGISYGSGNRVTAQSTTTLTAGQWYHIAGTIRGFQDADLYINGIKEPPVYSGAGGNTSMGYLGSSFTIGMYTGKNGGSNSYFKGKMDDFRFWNRELSAAEVGVLSKIVVGYSFDSYGRVADNGPYGLSVVHHSTGQTDDRFRSPLWATTLDGTQSSIELPASSLYKIAFPFTISAWVKINSQKTNQPIFVTSNHTPSKYAGTMLYLDNGRPAIMTGDNTGAGAQFRTSYIAPDSLKTGNWYQITAVCSALGNYTIYVNGSKITGASSSGTGTSMAHGSSNGYIGAVSDAAGGATKYFHGQIDEVMLCKGSLSMAEIAWLNKSMFITGEPGDTMVNNNSAANFSIRAIATETIKYQWYKHNGSNWSLLSGKTSPNLHFTSATYSDTGRYRCVLSTSIAADTSLICVLSVQTPSSTEPVNPNAILLYPVPANESVTIPGLQGTELATVYLANGQVQGVYQLQQSALQVQHLPAGIYLLRVQGTAGNDRYFRFIRN